MNKGELQRRYQKEARKLDRYLHLYHVDGIKDDYIPFLKSLVIKEHIPVDKVIESLPSPELVKKDKILLHELSNRFHLYMWCNPISYILTEAIIKDDNLSKYTLSYNVNIFDTPIETPFTLQEFLDSIENKEVTKLVKKKDRK